VTDYFGIAHDPGESHNQKQANVSTKSSMLPIRASEVLPVAGLGTLRLIRLPCNSSKPSVHKQEGTRAPPPNINRMFDAALDERVITGFRIDRQNEELLNRGAGKFAARRTTHLRSPRVTMVQSAESWEGLNPAYKRRADHDWPARGRVLREPEMRPVLMVVVHVLGHKPLEMPFMQNDDMVMRVADLQPENFASRLSRIGFVMALCLIMPTFVVAQNGSGGLSGAETQKCAAPANLNLGILLAPQENSSKPPPTTRQSHERESGRCPSSFPTASFVATSKDASERSSGEKQAHHPCTHRALMSGI
jgi:hypothetical protein